MGSRYLEGERSLLLIFMLVAIFTQKSAPAKSILHNRDETPLVRSDDAAVAETVYSESAAPRDDLELKHNRAKKVS